jgi:hypothetical protein
VNQRIRSSALTVLAAAVPFCLYLLTFCRGIPVGDAPELALAAANLQIAHPPGYPLLTNFGHIWSMLLAFLRPIIALNLLSGVFAALAAVLLYRLFLELAKRDDLQTQIIALGLAISFAAGRTLWSVATNFEVYSLSALLTVFILLLLVRFLEAGERRYLLLAAYCFGLALCNHLSVLAVGPAILIAALNRRSLLGVRDYAMTAFLAVLPGSFYLYLLIRPKSDLILSWYNPQSWAGFKQQIFAESYQRFLDKPNLADLSPYLHQLWQLLSGETVIPFLILGVFGLVIQWRHRSLAIMLSSVILVNIALNFSYRIADIAPYFLPSIIVVFIWMFELFSWLNQGSRLLRQFAVGTVLAIAVVCVVANYQRSDLSDRTEAEQYAKDLFDRVPQGGMLFCGSDNSMFPALYLRYGEGYRPDCGVYSHLPTLSHLQRDLNYQVQTEWVHFEDLLRYAVSSQSRPVVLARELMNYINDYPRLLNGLIASGLVYLVDSTLQINDAGYRFDPQSQPKLYDPKEAMLYCTYYLAFGETAAAERQLDGERYFQRAVQIVNEQQDPSLSSALATYFADRSQFRFVIAVIEPALQLATLRVSERLQLLGGLGTAQLRLDNLAAARDTYGRMLQLDPENSEARFQLLALAASAAAANKNFAEAIDAYKQMKLLAPDQHEVKLQLALLYLKVQDLPSARQELQRCIDAGYRVEDARALLEELDARTSGLIK